MSTSKVSHLKQLELSRAAESMKDACGTPAELLWRGHRSDFMIGRIAELPVGYRGRKCPLCGSGKLRGAILQRPNGDPVVETADAVDPLIHCADCGWADDSICGEHDAGPCPGRHITVKNS